MRNTILLSILSLTILGCSFSRSVERQNEQLRFKAPARIWEETLPLGNGRLGMMPDGGVEKERIVLNEISLWSGSEADYSNPGKLPAAYPVYNNCYLKAKTKKPRN